MNKRYKELNEEIITKVCMYCDKFWAENCPYSGRKKTCPEVEDFIWRNFKL